MSTQLQLDLSPPQKRPRTTLTPHQKKLKSEKSVAYRLFKLYKSNKFNHFTPQDINLLKKHYSIVINHP